MKSTAKYEIDFKNLTMPVTGKGPGAVNQKGLDFYDQLVNDLLEVGIEPLITLFHWDLPQGLQGKYGGWKSKETSRIFGDYSALLGKTLGDRVTHWVTINEIINFTVQAHKVDMHAPGGLESPEPVNCSVYTILTILLHNETSPVLFVLDSLL